MKYLTRRNIALASLVVAAVGLGTQWYMAYHPPQSRKPGRPPVHHILKYRTKVHYHYPNGR